MQSPYPLLVGGPKSVTERGRIRPAEPSRLCTRGGDRLTVGLFSLMSVIARTRKTVRENDRRAERLAGDQTYCQLCTRKIASRRCSIITCTAVARVGWGPSSPVRGSSW